MTWRKTFDCECKVVIIGELHNAEIHYCPKHKAAPDMYEALKAALPCINPTSLERPYDMIIKALAKAEGKKHHHIEGIC